MITFQGGSVAEVIQAFHDSVDDYLEFCAQRGENPEKPYSGQFVLRIDPQLHRALVHAAEARGSSLNALIEETLGGAFLQGQAQPSGAASGPLSRRRPPTGPQEAGRTKGSKSRKARQR
jgi:predicted HicB family RNase H-like nuclease